MVSYVRTQRMTIEATSKENDYSKHCVNYFQSWHMGATALELGLGYMTL